MEHQTPQLRRALSDSKQIDLPATQNLNELRRCDTTCVEGSV